MDNPPRPVVRALLTCKRVIEDKFTRDLVLVGPWVNTAIQAFPHVESTCIYAEFTSAHGTYIPSFQLRDMADETVWISRPMLNPIEAADPLATTRFWVFSLPIRFPAPGKYDLVWLLNGEEVTRRSLEVHYPPPPGK